MLITTARNLNYFGECFQGVCMGALNPKENFTEVTSVY